MNASKSGIDVSLVVCTRDRARQLSGLLASLRSINTCHRWEAVLVDNRSVDDTAAIIKAAADACPNIRYVYEDRPGLGAAREAGRLASRGELLSFTDDDCYVAPNFIDAVIESFRDHPKAGFIGGMIKLFDPADLPVTIDLREFPVRFAPKTFLPAGAINGANLSFRAPFLATAGGFDRSLGAGTPFPCEDVDAAAGVLWAGFEGWYCPRPLVYHHHGRRSEHLPALERSYDRGRGAYYAKSILNAERRRAYLLGWARRIGGGRQPTRTAVREIFAAVEYVRSSGRPALSSAAGGILTLLLPAITTLAAARGAARTLRRLSRRAFQ